MLTKLFHFKTSQFCKPQIQVQLAKRNCWSSHLPWAHSIQTNLMRAVRIHKVGGPEVLQLDTIEIPGVSSGTVRIKNVVSGANYIDTYHRSGLYPLPLPSTLGRDGAGTIDSIGEGVVDFKIGERVAYFREGSYADYTVVPSNRVVKLPDDVTFEHGAAAMVQGLTAHVLVKSSYAVKKGDTVLIQAAAGGVGVLLSQICRYLGAQTIIGTVSSQERAKIALESGCTHVIDYTKYDFVEETKKITGGKGCNVVYDGVGADTFEKGISCLARRGSMVLFGNASGKPKIFDPMVLAKGSLTLTRPVLDDFMATKEETKERSDEFFSWMRSGAVKIVISKVFPLKEAAEAHKFMESRQSTGKILLSLL